MTAKKQIAIRASELTIRQLSELVQVLGMNQTEVLTLAVDRLHQAEIRQQEKKSDDQTG